MKSLSSLKHEKPDNGSSYGTCCSISRLEELFFGNHRKRICSCSSGAGNAPVSHDLGAYMQTALGQNIHTQGERAKWSL